MFVVSWSDEPRRVFYNEIRHHRPVIDPGKYQYYFVDRKWLMLEGGKKNKVHCRNSRPLTIACHMKNLYLDRLLFSEPLSYLALMIQIYGGFMTEEGHLNVNSIIAKRRNKI